MKQGKIPARIVIYDLGILLTGETPVPRKKKDWEGSTAGEYGRSEDGPILFGPS